MRPLGRGVWQFSLPPRILSQGAVGGRREAAGPLGGELDQTFQDTSLGKVTWEQAEAALQGEALSLALGKARLAPEDLDLVLAGDLLNQCVSSTFGLLSFQIPFLGQYGACSTMAQTLLLGAMAVDSGACERAAAVTSSHFCAAERQFRLPLEYGGQRSPTAQWTATAAGARWSSPGKRAPSRWSGAWPGASWTRASGTRQHGSRHGPCRRGHPAPVLPGHQGLPDGVRRPVHRGT